jgi:hypothetical protein
MASPIERHRRMPLVLLAPAISKATQSTEITKMLRDAAITAIAMELYRRRHDRWPSSLDDLVPMILPSVPVDRFDGKPLKYGWPTHSFRPVLYCVGTDGDDDGGNPPRHATGEPDYDGARRWIPSSRRIAIQSQNTRAAAIDCPDGDWSLWPRPN